MDNEELARRTVEIAESAAAASWVAAIAAAITAVLTIGLLIGAIFAWRVARDTLDQSRLTSKQMEQDSVEQTRPYVYAVLVPSLGGHGAWDLLIRNSGRSSATDLTFAVSEWPEDDAVTRTLRSMLEQPQILPPDTTIRTFWYLGERHDPGSSGATGFDIPVDITVSYLGPGPNPKRYVERFHLNQKALGATPEASSGVEMVRPSPTLKKLSELVQAVNDLRRGH
ncbi:hypothetical protein RI444_15535 [Paenarthrobacter sp. AT5]|uniref:hypothetical protein n=1 Tax=Paenarthrobacter TaxID=1742992 RepID=UPI001A9988AB|nr:MULTISPECIES: hypothetical protein [Paenarthrobacter]QSZ53255.1 hypothetical protein AYX19_09735 [Paenarthrobacter ureafaciens]WOC59920.1 hypothetical protein RI444_15535 [Paenarthrobacter sp. AT5]